MNAELAALYAEHNRQLRRSRASYEREPLAASKSSAHCAINNAHMRGRISDTEAAAMRAEILQW